MVNLFFSCLISSVIMMNFSLLNHIYIFKDNKKKFYESLIYGPILLSIIIIILNFFIPINKLVGNFILLYSIINLIFFFIKKNFKIKIIKVLITTTIISFLLICLSNINRPDAGLYHLPYTSLINDNKIIIGASNIHFRFGHISSLQYLNASYYNQFLPLEFITLPMASIASFFYFFVISKFLISLKSDNINKTFILFFILVFSIYSFNRYSNFGNDAISHMYFFLIIILFIDISLSRIDLNKFFKLNLLAVFLFTLKPFMVFVFILPIIVYFFIGNYLKVLLSKNLIIPSIFFLIWIIKNILTTGCIIYPVNISCLENLNYFNSKQTLSAELESEAWAKDLPNIDRKMENYKNISINEYIKDFNWLPTWINNHFRVIVEKFLPYLILLTVTFIMLIILNELRRERKYQFKLSLNYFYLLFFSIICSYIWFIKFPIYRYGQSFLFLSFTIIFIVILNKIKINYNNKIVKNYFLCVFFIGVIGFTGKNVNRIYDNIENDYNNYPWPKIYTLDDTKENKLPSYRSIYDKNKFIYFYSGGQECMYSKSPCSNYLHKDLKLKYFGNYKVFYFEKT